MLTLRIRLIGAPPDCVFCLQKGKGASATRLPHRSSSRGDLSFELDIEAREGKVKGTTNFTGPFAQGTPNTRFFYLCAGRPGNESEPEWFGRIKITLSTIPWRLVLSVTAQADMLLEASYAATNARGSCALATVPLLEGGWAASPR